MVIVASGTHGVWLMRRLPPRKTHSSGKRFLFAYSFYFYCISFAFAITRRMPSEQHPFSPSPFPFPITEQQQSNAPGSWQSTVWILDVGCWMVDAGDPGARILESGAGGTGSGICSWQLPVARQNAFNFYGSNGVLCTISTAPLDRMCVDSYAFSSHRNCTLTTAQTAEFSQPPICMCYLLNAASDPQFENALKQNSISILYFNSITSEL